MPSIRGTAGRELRGLSAKGLAPPVAKELKGELTASCGLTGAPATGPGMAASGGKVGTGGHRRAQADPCDHGSQQATRGDICAEPEHAVHIMKLIAPDRVGTVLRDCSWGNLATTVTTAT